MSHKVFKISEELNRIVMQRTILSPSMLGYIGSFSGLVLLLGRGQKSLYGFLGLLLLILILIILEVYFSDYPSTIHISPGNILLKFRRVFGRNKIIEITSDCSPRLFIKNDAVKVMKRGLIGRLELHSLDNPRIIIYEEQKLSNADTMQVIGNMALKVSKITGFPIVDK